MAVGDYRSELADQGSLLWGQPPTSGVAESASPPGLKRQRNAAQGKNSPPGFSIKNGARCEPFSLNTLREAVAVRESDRGVPRAIYCLER